MIDDIKAAEELVEKMKENLPILAYPTKSLRISLNNSNNINLKSKSLLRIKDVLYMGNEGGICCAIAVNKEGELLIVSLTHLNIDAKQPLAKEIKSYQFKRRKALSNTA
jgi:hypothetical protein